MFRNKARLRGVLGIVLIFMVFSTAYLWDKYGREAFTYKDVLVLNNSVQRNTIIIEDMISSVKMSEDTIPGSALTNKETIIGAETAVSIPAGMPLAKEFFAPKGMALGEGKYIFKIPDNWIYSYPQTLRRGDTVYLYSVAKKNTDEYGEEAGTIVPSSTTPIVTAKVAYAKDTANKEVLDMEKNKARLDGTSVVGNVEIYVTDADYQALLNSYDKGNVLLILYN